MEVLEPAVYVLAGLSIITVGQRIWHVRDELTRVPARTPTRGDLREQEREATSRTGAQRKGRYQEDKVRVAIVGVGNCASSFVQGVQYYRDADANEPVPGLMHVELGGYHVGDIEFSAAFDIDAEKVGKDLSEAIFAGQNNTLKLGEGWRSSASWSSAA